MISSCLYVSLNVAIKAAKRMRALRSMAILLRLLDRMGQCLLPVLIQKALMSQYIRITKSFLNANLSLEDVLDFQFYLGRVLYIKPIQVREEITKLLEIIKEKVPKLVLEIGTAEGGTLFLFAQVASPDAKIISVDLPGGPFGGGYPEWKIPLYLSFARANQKIYLLRQDSHDPRTLNKVRSILGDQKLDFLFIDGDHSYEGVKKDFEMYSALVGKGGIIAFHDIVPDYFTRYGIRTGAFTGGVPWFWQEIKRNYKHQEIVEDYYQDGCGIGVIYWEGRS